MIAPAAQPVMPAAQIPSLPVAQLWPPPGLPLSTAPLQSSSRPLQASVVGWTFWLQTTPPAVQAVVPAAQIPSLPVAQLWPPPGLPLSTAPLQSSSRPLQISAAGWTFWLQTTAPLAQAVVPAAQIPSLP